jgi:DNA repair exonuclease SbcCD ATPase subunit
MRKVMITLLAIPFAIACNQEVKEQNAELTSQNEELRMENAQKDSLISSFVSDFASIQENLTSIREREQSIEAAKEGKGFENSQSAREQVMQDVEAINELLSQNKQTIDNLNDKVKRYSIEVGKFKRLVANLNADIEAKDQQVVALKEDLASMNFEMSRLNARLSYADSTTRVQSQVIEEQKENLNTAYYAVGTYQDLKENDVVVKKGGVIGIGSTKALATDFNKSYFTKIDITKLTTIPLDLDDDDVKLISNHPSESYKFVMVEDRVTALEILDPKTFWKTSKYLVVLVD